MSELPIPPRGNIAGGLSWEATPHGATVTLQFKAIEPWFRDYHDLTVLSLLYFANDLESRGFDAVEILRSRPIDSWERFEWGDEDEA